MRTPSVFSPRVVSQASIGAETGPDGELDEADLLGELLVLDDDGPAAGIGVPADVLGRRMDHDVGAEGQRLLQVRGGEGVVDDQQAPAAWAISAIAAMSVIFIIGFDGVSTHTMRVFPPATAARTASRSAMSTALLVMPHGESTRSISR
jgi:hypothetical protein